MLIRIDNDAPYPDLRRQTPGFSGAWGDLQVTFEPVASCDLLLVLNSPMRDIRVRCPSGNRWLMTQESPVPMYRWHTDSFRYFDKVFSFWRGSEFPGVLPGQTALPWHLDKSYDELVALTHAVSLMQKSDRVSWVTSNATHKPGHQLRMRLKDHLCAEGFDFDLLGRGFSPLQNKFDGIHPYKYSIAIENYACPDYWTEKIADCFLSWTMPIYWGAPNITEYFPAAAMIRVDPADPVGALATIRQAIKSDAYSAGAQALAEARDLVMNHYQLFPHLARLVDMHQARENHAANRTFVPAHPHHYRNETNIGHIKRIAKRLLRR